MGAAAVQFERITKRFPGVVALDEVSFSIEAGEVHALVGENGAGKSTLGKILAGIHRPSGGRVLIDGQPVSFGSPLDAAAAGVSVVHQELAFCPNLPVAENLFLGRMRSRLGLACHGRMADEARRMLERVGLAVDPAEPVGSLSTGQEQLLQIAAALGRDARIIVMDEPTSSLSQVESERLFALIDGLKARGVTVIYVSHRLEEIARLCDRVTVLRDGRYIDTRRVAEVGTGEIIRLMIGRSVEEYFPRHLQREVGPPVLAVQGLTLPGRFEDVSFEVHAGEVVGLAGLVGAGRSDIAETIFGIHRPATGSIRLDGRQVRVRDPRRAIELGIALLPEDRKRQGLVLTMTCKENVSLAMLRRLAAGPFLRHRQERRLAQDSFRRLDVRARSVDAVVEGLSGGNQQKVALAKWLAGQCRVLILDEPTRGVDVGAKSEIHALIDQLAAEGLAVLLISSELPEVLNLSTRILVLAGGRLVGELPRDQADQERLLRLMAGVERAA